MSNSNQVLSRLRRDARRLCRAFKISDYKGIYQMPWTETKAGIVYAEYNQNNFKIGIRITSLSGDLMSKHTLNDSLCHELTHAMLGDKDRGHDEKFEKIKNSMLIWLERNPLT